MTTTATATTAATDEPHDWQKAGDAWGHSAIDWSCLFEHYAIDVIIAIFERIGLSPRSTLLDVACGSGLALPGRSIVHEAARRTLHQSAQDWTDQRHRACANLPSETTRHQHKLGMSKSLVTESMVSCT